MKILMIAATHGNELLGVRLFHRLLQQRSALLEHIDFIVGNPRAYATDKRFIETDLNRSYLSDGTSYEEQRAREIEQYIIRVQPDIILDMHTTNCDQPSCLIVAGIENEWLRRYLRASHIDVILKVQPLNDITSLAPNVIGYEVSNVRITNHLLDDIIHDLKCFVEGDGQSQRKYLYTMKDKIYKADITEADAAKFVNFEMHRLGFVPILTGENSYKKQTNYLGFKSDAPEIIEV